MNHAHGLPVSIDVVSNVLASPFSFSAPELGTHEGLTSFSAIWSEMVLRDIAAPVHSVGPADQCCSGERRHPECYEMRDDARPGCRRYWRSVPSLTVHGCQFETREQMNGASAYLDGSAIYGTTDDDLHALRSYEDGQVEVNACAAAAYNKNVEAECLMQRVLLREHNRVARKLAQANVHWDDAKLFLEARRVVVAQLQHVTLNEYVPAIMREAALLDTELRSLANGFHAGYSSSNRAGTYDAVALAALRALAWTTSLRNGSVEEHVTKSALRVSLASAPEAAAWSIHEARDHGVPGYVRFLSDCTAENVKVRFVEVRFICRTCKM